MPTVSLHPIYPFSIIPNVKMVGDTVAQWLHPNPPSLPVALKDWESTWNEVLWAEDYWGSILSISLCNGPNIDLFMYVFIVLARTPSSRPSTLHWIHLIDKQ